MTVLITLTTIGIDCSTFDIYSDVDGFLSAFETDVPKASLSAGFSSANVPDGTTIIRVKAKGVCTNYIDITLSTITTTTTSSSSSTTTTTTTTIPENGKVYIGNNDSSGTITDVQVNSMSIVVPLDTFPILAGQSALGTYMTPASASSTIKVFFSVATNTAIQIYLSTGYTDCASGTGFVEFTGVDLSSSANITVELQRQGSSCT